MLLIYCKSVVESAICFAAICWWSSIRANDSKKLKKLIKKGGSARETALEPLKLIVQGRRFQNQLNIADNTAHPPHNLTIKQPLVYSQRLIIQFNSVQLELVLVKIVKNSVHSMEKCSVIFLFLFSLITYLYKKTSRLNWKLAFSLIHLPNISIGVIFCCGKYKCTFDLNG